MFKRGLGRERGDKGRNKGCETNTRIREEREMGRDADREERKRVEMGVVRHGGRERKGRLEEKKEEGGEE